MQASADLGGCLYGRKGSYSLLHQGCSSLAQVTPNHGIDLHCHLSKGGLRLSGLSEGRSSADELQCERRSRNPSFLSHRSLSPALLFRGQRSSCSYLSAAKEFPLSPPLPQSSDASRLKPIRCGIRSPSLLAEEPEANTDSPAASTLAAVKEAIGRFLLVACLSFVAVSNLVPSEAAIAAAPAYATSPRRPNSSRRFAESGTYIVRSKDSLWSIAAQHNLSVDELRELNPGIGDEIWFGQRIIVRKQEKQATNRQGLFEGYGSSAIAALAGKATTSRPELGLDVMGADHSPAPLLSTAKSATASQTTLINQPMSQSTNVDLGFSGAGNNFPLAKFGTAASCAAGLAVILGVSWGSMSMAKRSRTKTAGYLEPMREDGKLSHHSVSAAVVPALEGSSESSWAGVLAPFSGIVGRYETMVGGQAGFASSLGSRNDDSGLAAPNAVKVVGVEDDSIRRLKFEKVVREVETLESEVKELEDRVERAESAAGFFYVVNPEMTSKSLGSWKKAGGEDPGFEAMQMKLAALETELAGKAEMQKKLAELEAQLASKAKALETAAASAEKQKAEKELMAARLKDAEALRLAAEDERQRIASAAAAAARSAAASAGVQVPPSPSEWERREAEMRHAHAEEVLALRTSLDERARAAEEDAEVLRQQLLQLELKGAEQETAELNGALTGYDTTEARLSAVEASYQEKLGSMQETLGRKAQQVNVAKELVDHYMDAEVVREQELHHMRELYASAARTIRELKVQIPGEVATDSEAEEDDSSRPRDQVTILEGQMWTLRDELMQIQGKYHESLLREEELLEAITDAEANAQRQFERERATLTRQIDITKKQVKEAEEKARREAERRKRLSDDLRQLKEVNEERRRAADTDSQGLRAQIAELESAMQVMWKDAAIATEQRQSQDTEGQWKAREEAAASVRESERLRLELEALQRKVAAVEKEKEVLLAAAQDRTGKLVELEKEVRAQRQSLEQERALALKAREDASAGREWVRDFLLRANLETLLPNLEEDVLGAGGPASGDDALAGGEAPWWERLSAANVATSLRSEVRTQSPNVASSEREEEPGSALEDELAAARERLADQEKRHRAEVRSLKDALSGAVAEAESERMEEMASRLEQRTREAEEAMGALNVREREHERVMEELRQESTAALDVLTKQTVDMEEKLQHILQQYEEQSEGKRLLTEAMDELQQIVGELEDRWHTEVERAAVLEREKVEAVERARKMEEDLGKMKGSLLSSVQAKVPGPSGTGGADLAEKLQTEVAARQVAEQEVARMQKEVEEARAELAAAWKAADAAADAKEWSRQVSDPEVGDTAAPESRLAEQEGVQQEGNLNSEKALREALAAKDAELALLQKRLDETTREHSADKPSQPTSSTSSQQQQDSGRVHLRRGPAPITPGPVSTIRVPMAPLPNRHIQQGRVEGPEMKAMRMHEVATLQDSLLAESRLLSQLVGEETGSSSAPQGMAAVAGAAQVLGRLDERLRTAESHAETLATEIQQMVVRQTEWQDSSLAILDSSITVGSSSSDSSNSKRDELRKSEIRNRVAMYMNQMGTGEQEG